MKVPNNSCPRFKNLASYYSVLYFYLLQSNLLLLFLEKNKASLIRETKQNKQWDNLFNTMKLIKNKEDLYPVFLF